jgi:hypothetical protein
MASEVILDWVDSWIKTRNQAKNGRLEKKSESQPACKTSIPQGANKISILVGFLILPVAAFLPHDTPNLALIYLCCERASQLIIFTECMITFTGYDPEYWPRPPFLALAAFYVIGELVSVFAINELGQLQYIDGSASLPASLIASIVLMYTPLLLSYSYIHRWLRDEYWPALRSYLFGSAYDDTEGSMEVESFSTNKLGNASAKKRLEDSHHVKQRDDYKLLQIIYLMSNATNAAFGIVIDAVFWRVYDMGEIGLFLHNLVVIVFQLALLVLSLRSLKFDAIYTLVSTYTSNNLYGIVDVVLTHVRAFPTIYNIQYPVPIARLKAVLHPVHLPRDAHTLERRLPGH